MLVSRGVVRNAEGKTNSVFDVFYLVESPVPTAYETAAYGVASPVFAKTGQKNTRTELASQTSEIYISGSTNMPSLLTFLSVAYVRWSSLALHDIVSKCGLDYGFWHFSVS